MSIGLCDFFENILKMCNDCALGCVLELIVNIYLGGVLYEFCQKPTNVLLDNKIVGFNCMN